MKDKNGYEIMAGDIVRIEGSYFKKDNGLYFVEYTPRDHDVWTGDYCALVRINKKGEIKQGRNTGTWPIKCFVNDRMKRKEVCRHNEESATIEIVFDINNESVAEYFYRRYMGSLSDIEMIRREYGVGSNIYESAQKAKAFYGSVYSNIKKKGD